MWTPAISSSMSPSLATCGLERLSLSIQQLLTGLLPWVTQTLYQAWGVQENLGVTPYPKVAQSLLQKADLETSKLERALYGKIGVSTWYPRRSDSFIPSEARQVMRECSSRRGRTDGSLLRRESTQGRCSCRGISMCNVHR